MKPGEPTRNAYDSETDERMRSLALLLDVHCEQPETYANTERRTDCAKQYIVQSTVVSMITAWNALAKNLSSATHTPAAFTTVLWKLRQ